MPKFVVERRLSGAGELTAEELRAIWARSNQVVADLQGRALWLQTFVTSDKLYCIFVATDAEAIREHAELGGFPVDRISEVRTVADPATAGDVGA
jgi:hypothetical protein